MAHRAYRLLDLKPAVDALCVRAGIAIPAVESER